MPVSADSLQLAVVRETSTGVTPANPKFNLFRTTGEDLTFTPNTSESTELGGAGRFQRPANVTGMSTSGSINFELSKFPALDEAIAGVLGAAWGQCPLTNAAGGAIDTPSRITVGESLRTYTVEKRFTNPDFVSGTTLTATATGAPGATATVTLAGATAVGTGTVLVEVGVNGGAKQNAIVDMIVGETSTTAATKLATEISKLPGMSAVAAAGVVTITPDAGQVDTATARAGANRYYYQRYSGVTYSTLSLSVSPNNPVTGSVGFVGGVPKLDYLPLPGASYIAAGDSAVFTAPEVLAINMGSSMTIGTRCWTDLSIEIDSRNRSIQCIGVSGDKEVVLGTLAVTVSGTVYFSSQDVLQAMIDNRTIGDGEITLSNADNQIYRFDLFGLKPIEGSLTAEGQGSDLTIPLTVQPTPKQVCNDGTAFWESGLIISTVNTKPNLPAPLVAPSPVTLMGGMLAANAEVITVGGGPALAAQTATFTYQINGSGKDQTFVVTIAVGDDAATVIGKIDAAAKAAGTAGELTTSATTASTITIEKGTATSLDALSVVVV